MVTSIYLAIMAAFGTVHSPLAILAIPVGMLTGLAFAAPIAAFAAAQQNDTGFSTIYRFGLIPLFLFSGTFFPITQLPGWLQPVAQATPLYHGVALCRGLVLGHVGCAAAGATSPTWSALTALGFVAGAAHVPAEARDVTDAIPGAVRRRAPLRIAPLALLGTRRARRLVERNILVYRRGWVFFVSGFFEPFFYLLSIGVGLSKLVAPHPRRTQRHPLHHLRRPRAAGVLRHERRHARLDVQRVLQAEDRQDLRRRAVHPARRPATSPWAS